MVQTDVILEKLDRMHVDINEMRTDIKLNTEFRIQRNAETKMLWAIAVIISGAVSGIVYLLVEYGLPKIFV